MLKLKRTTPTVKNDKKLNDELQKINVSLEKTRAKLEKLEHQRAVALAKTQVVCGTCKKPTTVQDVDYIQTHWYVPPSGCTEGDYWNEGEGQFMCPACDAVNRLYQSPEIVRLKYMFRHVKDTY